MRYRFGCFQLDTERECVFGPGGVIALRPQTFAVLRLLIERAPAVVTHAEILDVVWGHSAISETAVAQTIKELRHAFADSARTPEYIETRRRRGYRMAAAVTQDVSNGDKMTCDSVEVASDRECTTPTSTSTFAPAKSAQHSFILAGGALAILIAVGASVRLMFPPESGSALIAHSVAPQNPAAARDYVSAREALLNLDARSANESLRRARTIAPDHAGIALALVRAAEVGGDHAAALDQARAVNAHRKQLERSEQLELDAMAARLEYRWNDAVAALTALQSYHPQLETAAQLLDAQIASGDVDAAGQTLAWLRARHADHPRTALAAAQLAGAGEEYAAQRDAADAAALWAERDGAAALAARALLLGARARMHGGELEAAETSANRARQAAARAGDPRSEGQTLLLLATMAVERAELDAAETYIREAQERFAIAHYKSGTAETQHIVGLIAERRGDLSVALAAYQLADKAFAALGDRAGVARMQTAIGTALARAGQSQDALLAFERAREIHDALGDRRHLAADWNNRGMLLARLGQSDAAQSAFERALETFENMGERRGQAVALGNLAALAGRAGQAERAIDLNGRALAMFKALGADADVARLAFNLGLAERRRGNLAAAEELLQQAAASFTRLGITTKESAAWTALGELQLRMGRPADATTALTHAQALEVEDPLRQASASTLAGRIAMTENRLADAGRAFEAARQLREYAGASLWVRSSELDLAELALRNGERVSAEKAAHALATAFAQAREHADHAAALRLLADSLRMQQRHAEAVRAAAHADEVLQNAPDAELSLRIALLDAQLADQPLALEGMQWVEQTAGAQGFRELELRAHLLRLRLQDTPANDVEILRLESQALGSGLLHTALLAHEAAASSRSLGSRNPVSEAKPF